MRAKRKGMKGRDIREKTGVREESSGRERELYDSLCMVVQETSERKSNKKKIVRMERHNM